MLGETTNLASQPRAVRAVVHPLSVLVVDAVAHAGVSGYVILYLGVAASWVGVPVVGAGVLARRQG